VKLRLLSEAAKEAGTAASRGIETSESLSCFFQPGSVPCITLDCGECGNSS